MYFPDSGGYGPGVKDYDVCDRPDVCGSCLQQRHLKAECKRLVLERLTKKKQGVLF
jgi:hypothetical protein